MSRIHEALRKAEEEKMAREEKLARGQHSRRASDQSEAVPEVATAAASPVGTDVTHEPRLSEVVPGITTVAAPPVGMRMDVTHEPWLSEISPQVIGARAPSAGLRPDISKPLTWDLVAARCPQRAWKPSTGMLFLNRNSHDHVGAEEFRTLRSRLYQIREKRPLKTVLVGSALPAEGKTFVSANLAQTLARQHGRRVVLLDCDLRRSRLHESFGTEPAPGVTDYMRDEADEFSILQRGPMDSLAFIPGGRQISNPAELIGNGRLELLLKRLAEVFDWIVIDSPPAVPVADASMIARLCDGILLVVHSGKTPLDLAQRARKEFQNMPLLGVVLNRVEAGSTYVSYYYGAYGKPEAKGSG